MDLAIFSSGIRRQQTKLMTISEPCQLQTKIIAKILKKAKITFLVHYFLQLYNKTHTNNTTIFKYMDVAVFPFVFVGSKFEISE